MDTPGEPRLGYQISTESHQWVLLTSETEWKEAAKLLAKRAAVAWSREVSMEIKDMVRINPHEREEALTVLLQRVIQPRPNEHGKNMENKRTRDNDIPPDVKPEQEEQLLALCTLQKHLHCTAHSKSGMPVYCQVNLGQIGVKPGHHEISHKDLTLWAQFIVSSNPALMNKNLPETQSKGLATIHLPPNLKKFDQPPAKKPRGPKAPPEVHIVLNIAPTPGVGGAMSYVVSQTLNLPPASAPGPLCPKEEDESLSLSVSLDGSSTLPQPPGCQVRIRNATYKLTLALAKCAETGTLLTTKEVLTLMDSKDPQEDGKYINSLGELVNFGIHNVIDIFKLGEIFLGTFGTLGSGGVSSLHQFTQNKILIPLGLHTEDSSELSIQVIEKPHNFSTVQKWRHKVNQEMEGIKEEAIEEAKDKVEEVEDEIEEVHGETTVVEVEEVEEVEDDASSEV
jgi:hypothetical protein